MPKQHITIQELQLQLIFNDDIRAFKNVSYIIKENFVNNPAEYTLEDLYCTFETDGDKEIVMFYDTKGKIYEGDIKVLMSFFTSRIVKITQKCGQDNWKCNIEFEKGSIDIEIVIE